MVKGWRKTSPTEYRKLPNNRYLQIGLSLNDSSKYGVYTQLPGKKMATLKKDIKRKEQALKFAKAYMRKY